MNHSRRMEILVVDDEESVRLICVRMLEPLGFSVSTAATGEEALIKFNALAADLVLTDYKMPGIWNGVTLAERIKRQSPQTQIILITAFPDVESAVGTLRLGGFDFLVKPFEKKDLIDCVQACFARMAAA